MMQYIQPNLCHKKYIFINIISYKSVSIELIYEGIMKVSVSKMI